LDIFADQIKKAANSAIQDAIKSAVTTTANKALASLVVDVQLGGGVEIDLGLFSNPTFVNQQYLTTQHIGEFYNSKQPVEAPFPAAPMPATLSSRMIQFFVSDFLANSAGFVYYGLGKLQFDVLPKEIPSWFPFQLNTSSFCDIIPELCRKFPNELMTLHIQATALPLLTLQSTGGHIRADGIVTFNILQGTTTQPAFTLGVTAYMNGTASIVGTNLTGDVTYLYSNISVVSSEVGNIPTTVIQATVDIILKQIVVPVLNTIFKKGMPLPTIDGITFVNPTIGYGDHYLFVASDLIYKPLFTVL